MKTNKRKLMLLMPSVGAYRIGFYQSLHQLNQNFFDITVLASATDVMNVKTVDSLGEGINFFRSIKYYTFFGERALWQNVLGHVRTLRKGDILLINGNIRYISNIVACLFAKLLGAKIIWWGHGWTAGGSAFNAKIRYFAMRFFDHVFLYTDGEVSRCKPKIGDNVAVSALNNGIDVKDIRSTNGEFSNTFSPYKIGFIGRIEDKSKLNLLIDAVALLKKNCHFYDQLTIDIVGDGRLLQMYKVQAAELGVNDKFIWHGAIWNSIESNKILKNCSIFVYPGAVGLSVIHAFALGLPAIVHNNFELQMPEIDAVQDGFNGLLYKYDDAEDLAKKITAILSDTSILSTYRKNAFDTVTENYNTQVMAERFYNVISKL